MTVIVTKRLRLIEPIMSPSMIECMVAWLNDKEIVKYSEQRHRKHTVETQIEYLTYAIGFRRFRYICVDDTDTFIGTIVAHIDKNNSVADVGILIGEKTEWSKGYGTEAWQAFCDVLLTREGIRKIEAGAMACNFQMIKIFKKTGMHPEGTRDHHFQFGDVTIGLVQYARFI